MRLKSFGTYDCQLWLYTSPNDSLRASMPVLFVELRVWMNGRQADPYGELITSNAFVSDTRRSAADMRSTFVNSSCT